MIDKIKTRLASDEGFTLIELLVVIVILGILVAIAVPAYLSFRGNAQDAAAKSNVRSAIPAAEGYYQANDGTATDVDASASTTKYQGMTGALLRSSSPGVGANVLAGPNSAGDGYCIQDTENNNTFSYTGGNGGSGSVGPGACASTYTVS